MSEHLVLRVTMPWRTLFAPSPGSDALQLSGKNTGDQEMAKSSLTVGAFALVGAVALATPSWASGATSAVKKVGGPIVQADLLYHNHIGHQARYQSTGATTSTEFSSVNRTGGHNVKWK